MYEVRRTMYTMVTADDYARISSMSKADGIPISEWVRRCISTKLVAIGQPPLDIRGRTPKQEVAK